MATLILTNEFKSILEKQKTIDALASNGYNSAESFEKEILSRLNKFDSSLNLKSISYHHLQDSDTYLGIILDEYLNKLYNVCVIPPTLGTRSGFLSQQIFGFISNLINGQKNKNPYSLCDKSVIIVNCMVDSLANSAICNIIGSKIVGFHYIDIFNRNEDFGNSILNLRDYVNTVSQYKTISKDIELTSDTLILKTQRLKDFSTSLTNEPYYFAITAYPAVILAKKEGYTIDTKDFEEKLANGKSNKNIDAFLKFVKDLKTTNPKSKSLYLHKQLQLIYYGAPGTGKSRKIKDLTDSESVIRTTFHPDSDYSTFVGAYKPTMIEEDAKIVPVVINNGISLNQNNGTYKEKRISYKFVMQAFLKAYLGAWKKYADRNSDCVRPQFLVIEEINRGNCAQIFGDLFQLLDRGSNHFSEYPIEADTDLQQEIERAFKENNDYKLTNDINVEDIFKDYTSNYGATLSEDIQHGRVLLLPSNLYIWATMNTSDQSLFPIDSAFKRRWDWEYMKIKNEHKDWKVNVELKSKDNNGNDINKKVDWWEFVEKINEIIASMTSSADKQLGYFFCKATEIEDGKTDPTIITKDTFVSKVIFYLWNDVFKDYGFDDATLFRYKKINPTTNKEEEKDLTFPDFYDENGENVNIERLTDFITKVLNWKMSNEENN